MRGLALAKKCILAFSVPLTLLLYSNTSLTYTISFTTIFSPFFPPWVTF